MKDGRGNCFSKKWFKRKYYLLDTLNLVNGCYLFDLRDTGEDGLTWWARQHRVREPLNLKWLHSSIN
ncbi:MAG: hypothetical protein IPG89_05955 [Bacteroidetes bacterium]|nr:hypothetical protein [Bacteroidota bacterium]